MKKDSNRQSGHWSRGKTYKQIYGKEWKTEIKKRSGRKHTNDELKRISKNNKGKHNHWGKNNPNYNNKWNYTQRKHLSELHIGTHLSEIAKRKISKKTIIAIKQGRRKAPMLLLNNKERKLKGKRHSKTMRRLWKNPKHIFNSKDRSKKISEAISGKNHPNWLGGKSFEPYSIEFNKEFKNLVRLRDNFCCLNCGISEQKQIVILGKKLAIHHINYDKKNTCLYNCITLCSRCNTLANKNRSEWVNYYQEKLSKLYSYKYNLAPTVSNYIYSKIK